MGLASRIKSLNQGQEYIVSSVPAFYTAAAHNIFAIAGGMVLITGLIEYVDVDVVNATTTTIDIGAVSVDAGAVAINAAGTGAIVASPLRASAKAASALAAPLPDETALAAPGGYGILAAPGVNITVTFATVMVAAGRYSLHVIYKKIHPNAIIR